MKNFCKFFVMALSAAFLAGCSIDADNDINSSSRETSSLAIKFNGMAKISDSEETSSDSSRAVFTPSISKATVTIVSSDFSAVTQTVDMSGGANAGDVVFSEIPVGKNRLVIVQAYQKDSEIPGMCLKCVTSIVGGSSNSVSVNWSTTALGNVYYNLLNSGKAIASYTDSQDEAIAAAVDTTAKNALLVDASSIASDFLSGSLKSKDSYLLTPGSVTFTYYYPIESCTAYFNEPCSDALTECKPGVEYTISNCSPGKWTLYLYDTTNSAIIGTASLVTVTAGNTTEIGVVSYDGIMIVSDASENSSYKYLYTWNYNGAGNTAYGSAYPGDTMTQYGDYYISAYPACSTLNLIASDGSNKLYSEDIALTKQGIYLLSSASPGYTVLKSTSGSSGDGYEDPDTIDFDNALYINLTAGSWSTTESGTYTAISTKKATIGTESNYVKVQYTKDDDSNSTGLIEINAKNSSGASAFYFTGTMTTGGVKLQTNGTDDVMVYLNGVTMNSSNYPCIEVTKGSKTYLYVTGTNTLTDGRAYGTGYGEEFSTSSSDTYEDDDGKTQNCAVSKSVVKEGSSAKGTVFSKGNLILAGTGTLTVTESYKNCIASKGFITVASGTYTLTSNAKNGFDARYGFTQDGGDITFTGNGGISASTTSNSTSYYVKKANGIAVDGIISSTDNGWIKINDGSYTCTAAYGKGMNAKWDSTDEENENDGTTGTPDPSVYISGGTISITVTGTGWTGDNTSGKTYYYYDADGVECSGNIKAAAEGIEAASKINISGGTIEVTAADDGLNESTVGGSITITGGSLYALASGGDAVDSNGNIYVTGGTVVTSAATGSEDGLDAGDGYSVTISGGLVASCSGSSNASASASNCVVINGKSLSASSGATIAILDSSSNLLYAFTVPTTSSSSSSGSSGMGGFGGMGGSSSGSFSSIIMTSPNFTSTGTYTVYTAATVTGGTSFHGLYTTLPSVSSTGSSSKTVSISSTSGSYTCGSSGGFGR